MIGAIPRSPAFRVCDCASAFRYRSRASRSSFQKVPTLSALLVAVPLVVPGEANAHSHHDLGSCGPSGVLPSVIPHSCLPAEPPGSAFLVDPDGHLVIADKGPSLSHVSSQNLTAFDFRARQNDPIGGSWSPDRSLSSLVIVEPSGAESGGTEDLKLALGGPA